jgi:putative flavoprotein involved in K+ transport
MTSPAVIIATGINSAPAVPAWAEAHLSDRVIHSDHYRNAEPYRGRDVLVVGCGSTAHDIALDLHRGRAGRVRVSMRTPPLLAPRWMLGTSSAVLSVMIKHGPPVPRALIDTFSLGLHRACFPAANRVLGKPPAGLDTSLRDRGHGLTVEIGFLKAVQRGHVTVVPEAVGLREDTRVQLADATELIPDAVILATGHRPNLAPLVGHLAVLGGR